MLLATSLLASCDKTKEREPTAVVVAIEAERMVRASIDSVYVEIASGPSRDQLDTRATERFDLSDGGRWPLTLTLLPKTAGTNAFRIWVRAQRDGEDVSELRVISGFAAQRVMLLEVLLPDECIGFLSCGEDETCFVDNEGVTLCDDASVAVAALVPFTEEEIERILSDAGPDEPVPDSSMSMPDSGEPIPDSGEPMPDSGPGPEPDAGPGSERCDNGDDDDRDGDIDCADDDCNTGYSCVPQGDELAIMLTDIDEACPSGFEEELEVSNELIFDTRCSGCGCTAQQASDCRAPVFFFDSVDACNAAGADSAGTFVGYAVAACGQPIGDQEDLASPFGWRIGDIEATSPASCNASGSPQLDEPEWRRTRKLCRATRDVALGGGCDDGYACAPRVETDTGSRCAVLASGQACLGGIGQEWYESFRDNRSCAACSCSLQGGTCDAATARLGSDYLCDVSSPHAAGEGERQCFASSVYYPPADLSGGPSTATCTSTASTLGTVELLGGHRVCCAP